ncbi:MAG: LLM class flavin-dependent oxidoreductase [Candidatus Rokuibacteriota bacterium]|nr:MAG: LLM class flavin-dependent oxidoreductase [Candidatus Rokubacteria bacterium]
MALKFGIFDHIEPVPGLRLDQIYRERLIQIERLERAGFSAYHLAEHHTPAIHSLAPSQNVFLAAVAQRTTRLRFGPCVYVLPLHHPLRLIEEISMLDNLSGGRLEIGVGRGGVMEAFFWGQEADSETNYARYVETLAILREGLSHDQLTYAGRFHSFDKLPMYLRPLQQPYPPLWYMRNPVTAAMEGMHTIIVGSIDGLAMAVPRYRAAWEEHQGAGTRTVQGQEPMIGLVVHMVVAETDAEALAAARPAWEKYRWNLAAPRRLEAEKRNLTQFMSTKDGSFGFVGDRPAGLPGRELRRDIDAELERFDQVKQGSHPNRLGGVALAGTPTAVREYMDEYVATGANYFVCSFQWGDLSHAQAMRSIELFATEVMPAYATAAPAR